VTDYEGGSVLCRAKGTACAVTVEPPNPNCIVVFHKHLPENSNPDTEVTRTFSTGERGNLNDADFMGGCTAAMQAQLVAQGLPACTPAPVMDNGLSSFIIKGSGCAVVLWDGSDGWADYAAGGVADNSGGDQWLTYRVPHDKAQVIVTNKDTSEVPVNQRQPGTVYRDMFDNQGPHWPGHVWNDKATSFWVTRMNSNYCTSDSKPATTITCEEDRGCCWTAVYGMWHTGVDNIQLGEEDPSTGQQLNHFCLNLSNECKCDEHVGVECRDIRYERRKYRCAEWISADGFTLWDQYYLRSDDVKVGQMEQALVDWADGPGTPICKIKEFVETLEMSTDAHLTYTPLTRWQYASGCPEPNHGLPVDQPDKNLGSTVYGSMNLATNEFFGNQAKANDWECSGDAYWFTKAGFAVQGGDNQECSGIITLSADELVKTQPSTGGLFPQQCRDCGKDFTEHWCTCHWHSTDWTACHGCGDVQQYRKVDCRRVDSNDDDARIRSCSQATLDTFGSCCYQPLFYSGCGGCTQGSMPTTEKHCTVFSPSACKYEWHVQVGASTCDKFVRCVPKMEWDSNELSKSASSDMRKQWCTAGPQRHKTSDAFVVYGLGACWLPDTLLHNPSFVTAQGDWPAGYNLDEGRTDCECYYGGKNFFGTRERGTFPKAVAANTMHATRFQLDNAAWAKGVTVATETTGGSSIKGAIYTDNMGVPGVRIAITATGVSSTENKWVELKFAQVDDTKDNSGVYLGGGSYWVAVAVGGTGTTLLITAGTDSSTVSVSEEFDTGNASPAIDFGSGTSETGRFSAYVPVTFDDTVHITKDISQLCYNAATCDECMRTMDTRAQYNVCAMVDRTVDADAQPSNYHVCEPRDWMQVNGYAIDHSCHTDWGVDMYLELIHWRCTGEEAANPEGPGNSATTLEECAEDCRLAKDHWFGWNGYPLQVPSSVGAYDCKGFNWEENSATCTLFSAIHQMENTVSSHTYDKSLALAEGTSERCFVPKEGPNPCAFNTGEFVRKDSGDYYYVGEGGFLSKVVMDGEEPPSCDGVGIFGSGNTAPEEFCNGYYEDVGNNLADLTCARCVNQMVAHNMVIGDLDGSPSSCGGFGSGVKRVCQDQLFSITCVRGSIEILGGAAAATFSRQESNFCPMIPVNEQTGAALYASATQQCGSSGNVASTVQSLCDGKMQCSFQANSDVLGDQGCPGTYKYLEVSYRCSSDDADAGAQA